MISYRVRLENDSNGTILVVATDFPELTTYGEDREDALSRAVGALEEAIEARISEREPVPERSKGKACDPRVTLPAQAAVKVPLYQQMHKAGLRKFDLARRMDLHRREIDCLLDLNHATSLAKIEKTFAALGKTLDIAVSEARASGARLNSGVPDKNSHH
ncbi:MAG: type II toxin-antitoxin system HicB family antitoxin [Aestuariivirga sp.]|uniref:type II toxin-antitoxin system HicB family antitoxin n=1 Tax=Aestuariivirga sp. TaxID=2650926 RepID=UPI0038D0FF29